MKTQALTYDDIQLIPEYSEVESRKNINLETQLTTNYRIRVPLIASPMDTVCESPMAIALGEMGGVGCIHRFMTIDRQADEVWRVWRWFFDPDSYQTNGTLPHDKFTHPLRPIMAAVGATGDFVERAQALTEKGANVILIDVAHGFHKNVRDAIAVLKSKLPSHVDIIAGNVANGRGARALADWGADAIRVGVGGGSLCTTRIKTGFGVPNVTALIESVKSVPVPIIADGGIRTSGDIAKALAVGANSVMLGSLLAGTKEAPGQIIETPRGLYKRYRGAASLETKNTHGQEARNVEGEATTIPFKGGVEFVVEGLLDGLRSALSYGGARNLDEFFPEYVVVTNAGVAEARPHLL